MPKSTTETIRTFPIDDDDDWGDYPIPGARESAATTIPRPSVFGTMWMLLAIAVVNVIVGAAIRIVIGAAEGPFDDLAILGRLASLLVGFAVTAGLLASMLPTTLRRGCLGHAFRLPDRPGHRGPRSHSPVCAWLA